MVDHKKAKKIAIKARNKRDWTIFRHNQQIDQEQERIETQAESMAPAPAPKTDTEIWSAKVGEIRNRLTDKKRTSTERWNRFAGTGDSGGRGL